MHTPVSRSPTSRAGGVPRRILAALAVGERLNNRNRFLYNHEPERTRTMKSTIATLATLFVVGAAQANVTITGQGKVTYTPNMAYVHATVSSDAKTAQHAWAKNSEIVQRLFLVLKDYGIDEK